MPPSARPAADAGEVAIGDVRVPRFGVGTMRLTGPGIWGPPRDRDEALRVLRRAYELGVRVVDTAWYYGPSVAHQLVAEALSPYPDDLLLVTKLGGRRSPDKAWHPALLPHELRAGCEEDLRLLGVDCVPVTHLRWMAGQEGTSFEDALGTLIELRDEGKIRRIGLSSVTLEQLDLARRSTEVVTVSNSYSVGERGDDPVVDRCAGLGIAYLPFFPLAMGRVGRVDAVAAVADELGASAA